MNNQLISHVLIFYGIFLIGCGIAAVLLIGLKAKTALISGGGSGGLTLLISWLISQNTPYMPIVGLIFSLALFKVFSWRSYKTLMTIFKMIKEGSEELNGKAIAFLIIALMAVVSIVVTGIQFVLLLNR